MTTPAIAERRDTSALLKRYRDAYRVANAIVAAGTFIKITGVIGAGLIVLGALLTAGSSAQLLHGLNRQLVAINSELVSQLVIIAGFFVAATFWFFIWLVGVLVSAIGQICRATVDTAVNTSPLLDDETRSKILPRIRVV